MIKIIKNIDEVYDFVYEMSCDNHMASYPRMVTEEKITKNLLKAIESNNQNLLAFYNEEVLFGVCIYFWIEKENYAQASVFLIKNDYEMIASQFIGHIESRLKGYELLIGVPMTNDVAISYFNDHDMKCIESSIVTHKMCVNVKESFNHPNVMTVTKENFGEYRDFHDQYAIPYEMYFTSKNLLDSIDDFEILMFKDEKIHASIFASKGKHLTDIIGLFIDKKSKQKGIESILIHELLYQISEQYGEVGEVLYFVDEEDKEAFEIALEEGFQIKEKYRCFKKQM